MKQEMQHSGHRGTPCPQGDRTQKALRKDNIKKEGT